MRLLPNWVLTNKYPANYDSESATVIEQTAKLYGAMNELIEEFNKYIDGTNSTIEEFITTTNSDLETFKVGLRQEFQDFINVVDLKLMSVEDTIEETLNAYINEGKLALTEYYDEENEALTIELTGGAN